LHALLRLHAPSPPRHTEHNKPLAAAQYFSKQLSRHGKGAAAMLNLGHKVRGSKYAVFASGV
jgi:hypothetical protein